MQLSSLSNQELVQLKATLHAIENQELICSNCLQRYGDNEAAGRNFRATRGCETPVPAHAPPVAQLGVLRFRRCVGNFVSPHIMRWVTISEQYGRGVMPFPGSLMEQPAKAIELFTEIEAWRADLQARRMKEQQQKMERKMRSIGRKPRHN